MVCQGNERTVIYSYEYGVALCSNGRSNYAIRPLDIHNMIHIGIPYTTQ